MDQSLLTTKDLIGMYWMALETNRTIAWVDAISNLFTSDQGQENYPFLGQSPAMREWIGGRQAKGLRQDSLTIVNRHFESTLEFAIRDLRRDKTAQIDARISEWADQDSTHWATLLSTLILNGAAGVAYDGAYFYDTAHAEGDSGAQSNSIQVDISEVAAQTHGVATAPSVEEMQHAILRGIAQIMSLKDDRGRPMNQSANGFLVLAPTSLYLTAAQAVSMVTTANSAVANLNANVLSRFSIGVEMNSELDTWTDKFAIFRTDNRIKALIRQSETTPALMSKDESSDFAFDHKAVQIGLDTWRNADYGFWQRSCLVQLT